MCVGDNVYVQEQLCNMKSRDASLQIFHYPVQTYSTRKARVLGIDGTCTKIVVQYHSKGTRDTVHRSNVRKVNNES